MKVAIIGKGTSAIITALHLIEKGFGVEFFYDPKINPLNVGESTVPSIQRLINRVLNISIGDLFDQEIISYKNGIKYIGWGSGEFFRHHFNDGTSAFHFESSILNNFIHDYLESNLFIKYHSERVNDYKLYDDKIIINQRIYDFVVNCAGWSSESDYYTPPFETVNASILYTRNNFDDPTYTLHKATEDGWEFGLPFPHKNVTKCGYLYNKNFSNPKIEGKKISWTQRYSKKLIQSNVEAYNGNRLFFFEPLEALSLLYYEVFANEIANFLVNGRKCCHYQSSNNNYLNHILNYLNSIYWIYQYGSIYKTPFWEDVREKSSFHFRLRFHFDSLLDSYYIDQKGICDNNLTIGPFDQYDFRDIHSGMTQKNMSHHISKVFRYPV